MKQRVDSGHSFSTSKFRDVILIILGLGALIFYYSWWFMEERLTSPWLLIGFITALSYGGIQIAGTWLIYLAAYYSPQISPPLTEELTVDIFLTACREEYALIERTLMAACAMRGNYKIWLLDDGHDPALAHLAEQSGVGYLTRQGRKDAKAGNINAALPRTQGDIVAIFDIDHAPKPNFLERSLGYFTDPKMGFVQVMLTFENNWDGWVAQAAGETSYDFYNPTSIGANGVQSATLIGTNALIRRKALESIGGYQPGLAEDLETSIALHAAGWRSAYVAEPLAPGYAPSDLLAWFTQQFKWARGVFEALLTAYPCYFFHLKPGQRLFYLIRMTYYWAGMVTCIHLFITLFALLWGSHNFLLNFQQYLIHLLPLLGMFLSIRILAFRRWGHPSLQSNLQINPIVLVFATWPIYTLAWLMALLRVPLGFRPTPKSRGDNFKLLWLIPQIGTTLLLLFGLGHFILMKGRVHYTLVSGFAASQAAIQLLFLGKIVYERLVGAASQEAKGVYSLKSQISRLLIKVSGLEPENIETPGS